MRLLPPWKWGIVIFTVHAVVVAVLVAVSSIALFGGSAWWGGGLILRVCEFWVYRWVFPWFNDPVFARPSFLLFKLSGSSPSLFGAVYEWLMVSTFGGVVYAMASVVWVSWRRRRGLNVAASSAA
jgi:hypothetical protein